MCRIPEVEDVILGPVSHYDYPPRDKGGINPPGALRTKFKLYANIRPCWSWPEPTMLRKPMDVIIVRENTEGFYSDRNMFAGTGRVHARSRHGAFLRKITARASSAVARAAFNLALHRCKKVMAAHKTSVVTLFDGLFLREVRCVAADYHDVTLEEVIVDAAAALR